MTHRPCRAHPALIPLPVPPALCLRQHFLEFRLSPTSTEVTHIRRQKRCKRVVRQSCFTCQAALHTHWFRRRALTALLSGKPISVSWRSAISSTLSSSSSSSMAAHTQTKQSSDALQPHTNPCVNGKACVKFKPRSLSHPFFCFCPQFATSSCNSLHSARSGSD